MGVVMDYLAIIKRAHDLKKVEIHCPRYRYKYFVSGKEILPQFLLNDGRKYNTILKK